MTFGGIFSMVIHAINLLNNYALDVWFFNTCVHMITKNDVTISFYRTICSVTWYRYDDSCYQIIKQQRDSWLMPYLAWWVYVTISEMHETGGVWDKI
jgi:hypothetical protein